MAYSQRYYRYTVVSHRGTEYTSMMKTLSGARERITESNGTTRNDIKKIEVIDLVPVFESTNFDDIEEYVNTRKKSGKKRDKSRPDDLVPGLI